VVGVTGPAAGVNPMAPASIRDAVPDDYNAFARFFAELHAPEPVPSARVYEQVAPRAFLGVELGSPSAFLCWRPKGADKLYGGIVQIDEDARVEYWTKVREEPDSVHLTEYRASASTRTGGRTRKASR
jgi:hypothetical protein